ncbi:hypothetical protein DSO57_1030537 [Entomophthora muscae]|uniref:Uncharacterized protein n=1 Tax=Entomophthora muscae TaxID=34485 RepID=A0ACC2TN99_9FUNG|nr:hypothetical protein DSO57_1030537 [Entomophthora muscae]
MEHWARCLLVLIKVIDTLFPYSEPINSPHPKVEIWSSLQGVQINTCTPSSKQQNVPRTHGYTPAPKPICCISSSFSDVAAPVESMTHSVEGITIGTHAMVVYQAPLTLPRNRVAQVSQSLLYDYQAIPTSNVDSSCSLFYQEYNQDDLFLEYEGLCAITTATFMSQNLDLTYIKEYIAKFLFPTTCISQMVISCQHIVLQDLAIHAENASNNYAELLCQLDILFPEACKAIMANQRHLGWTQTRLETLTCELGKNLPGIIEVHL